MVQSCFLQCSEGQKARAQLLIRHFLEASRGESAQKCRSASPRLHCEDLSLTVCAFVSDGRTPVKVLQQNKTVHRSGSSRTPVLAMDYLYLLMYFSLNHLLLDHIFAADTHGKLRICWVFFLCTLHYKCMLMCKYVIKLLLCIK